MATDILQKPHVAAIIGAWGRLRNLAIKLVLLWWVEFVASCCDFCGGMAIRPRKAGQLANGAKENLLSQHSSSSRVRG